MKSLLESRLSVWFLCKEEWEGGLLKGSCLCQRISLIFSQIKEVPFGVHTLAYTRKATLSLELDHVINSILPQSKTACLGIRLWRARNQVRSWPVIPRNWKALWARGVVPVLKKWRTSNPPGSFLRPLFCPDSLASSDGILHKPIPLLGTTHSLSLNVQGSLRRHGDLECTPHFSHKVEEGPWSKPVHKKKLPWNSWLQSKNCKICLQCVMWLLLQWNLSAASLTYCTVHDNYFFTFVLWSVCRWMCPCGWGLGS